VGFFVLFFVVVFYVQGRATHKLYCTMYVWEESIVSSGEQSLRHECKGLECGPLSSGPFSTL